MNGSVVSWQVFRPDKMNGFEVQREADAMLERQRRDVMPRFPVGGSRTPARPLASRLVSAHFTYPTA